MKRMHPRSDTVKIFFFAFICIGFLSVRLFVARADSVGLLYVTDSPRALASLRAHASSMDIVSPQTYAATPSGRLIGTPNEEILKLSRDVGARVMPLVVNQNFSQTGMHKFLGNTTAQSALIAALISEAKTKGYIGYQYDFEHMQAEDRDLYSAFVARSVPYFHGAGLQLSVAMAPQHSANPAAYGAGSWENWTGAFDYAAIGAAADFVSVMAYDDSLSLGPVASVPWVNLIIAYTLERIPANKVSLGVPFYAWVWDNKTGKRVDIRGYPSIAAVLTSNKQLIRNQWSSDLGVMKLVYKKGGKTYTAWYEDQQSFREKLSLVSGNKLFGFSAWALGLEDPRIWSDVAALNAMDAGLAMQ
jgi:spore germination protein YaaH